VKIINIALPISLLAVSVAAFASPAPGIPNLTGIAKDPNGKVIYMNSVDAVQYCQKLGDRLPTARELALWATQYGAKISDTPQDGFAKINGTDAVFYADTFYYQNSAFKAPLGEMGIYTYWSSSPDNTLPSDSDGFPYDTNGGDGYFYAATGNCIGEYCVFNAVLCVQPR